MATPKLRAVPTPDAEAALQAAIEQSQDRIGMRHFALKLAAAHYGKSCRYTTDQAKIVELAEAFYAFLVATK